MDSQPPQSPVKPSTSEAGGGKGSPKTPPNQKVRKPTHPPVCRRQVLIRKPNPSQGNN